jgi:hypothetical protein
MKIQLRVPYRQERRDFSLGRTAFLVVPVLVVGVLAWGFVATRGVSP